jgi:hypothetical protein
VKSLEWQIYQLQNEFNPRHVARFVLAVFNQSKGDVSHWNRKRDLLNVSGGGRIRQDQV